MNLRPLLITAVALAASVSAVAQVNADTPSGDLLRSHMMFRDSNFNGCLDQLSRIDRGLLSDRDRCDADLLRARATFRSYGAGAALPLFKAFLASYPYAETRSEARMGVADCLYDLGHYAEALKAYDAIEGARLSDSNLARRTYNSAYCLLEAGAYGDAAERFAAVAADAEYSNPARFYLGYIAYLKGDYAEAKNYLTHVSTATSPGDMADYYLMQIYFREKDYSRALTTARNMLRRQGKVGAQYTQEARRIAAESYYYQGNRSEAAQYLRQYLASYLDDTLAEAELSALYIAGEMAYDQGDYADAVRCLRPVTASAEALTTPEGTAMVQSAYLYIGQALYRQGDLDAALMAFDKAIKLDGADPGVSEAAFYNYAAAKYGGANIPFGSSVATLREFLRRYPDGPYTGRVQEFLVAGYLSDNDYEAALEGISEMSHPGPKVLAAKQQVLYTLGSRALSAGNPTKALEYLTAAEPLRRHDASLAAEIDLLAGEASAARGDYGTAARYLNQYLRTAPQTAPNRAVALYDLGYAEFGAKSYDAAENAFMAVTAMTGPKALSAAAVADSYNRLGDIKYYGSAFPAAAEYYARAYETNPSAGDYALFQGALMEGYANNYPAKVDGLGRLRTTFPTSPLIPDAMLEITEAYLRMGQTDKALDVYRQLTEQYPGTAQGRQGYLQMALTLIGAKRRDEGIQAYKEVITRYPTSDEATQAATMLRQIYVEDGNLDGYLAFINGVDNAPRMDDTEAEIASFESATVAFYDRGETAPLKAHVDRYPNGAHTPEAMSLMMAEAAGADRNNEALDMAAALLDRFPDSPQAEEALVVKAQLEYDLGQGYAALESWQTLEKRASTPEYTLAARLGIMRVARDLADYDRMLASADAILASSAIGAEVRNEAVFSKAQALYNTDRTAEALDLWQSIADNTDDLYGAKAAYALAEARFEAKDIAGARTLLEKFIDSGTPHAYWLARGFILMSDVYAAEGKTFEAREYLQALRENYPGKESDIYLMIDQRLNNSDNE